MKPIRLQVEMPVIGTFSIKGRSGSGEIEQPVETTVIGLRRREYNGVLVARSAMALAFVPEQFRRHLREAKRLVDGEYAWCVATAAANKKSLAPFMASGDREWGVEESNVSGIKVSSSKSNITKHRATLDEKVMLRVLSEAVAKAAGIDLDADGVSVRSFVTSRDSSTGFHKEAVVEITVDHDAQPRAADE
ncbi:hypothetical protein [Paraburkholderia pallida]|uniref:Uncharacterized protein n=1 Tax=Paraburkholderia pallida TaxID=2547399 RepID=A0A4P7CWC5_9BURK|nr:hypothetical protein [Paraburkholderia pallida]QBR00489.1 hypothetical protein E1956_25995 [Paraburkholderia pallida]